VLLLGLHWQRMSRVGAILAMGSGLAVSMYYILTNHPWVQIKLNLTAHQTSWFGLEPFSAGVFGVPVGLALGVLGSWLWPHKGFPAKAL
jgi:cation/acetate symporter